MAPGKKLYAGASSLPVVQKPVNGGGAESCCHAQVGLGLREGCQEAVGAAAILPGNEVADLLWLKDTIGATLHPRTS